MKSEELLDLNDMFASDGWQHVEKLLDKRMAEFEALVENCANKETWDQAHAYRRLVAFAGEVERLKTQARKEFEKCSSGE